MSFSCTSSTLFCPLVPSEITCDTTNSVIRWAVTGDLTGVNDFAVTNVIGTTKPVGDQFTAIKTGNTSFILNFTSQIEFDNSITVTCIDLLDINPNTADTSCTIMLYGMK